MSNIVIKAINVYHPENVVDNEFYIERFKKQDRDIRGYLEGLGKDKRYIIDNENENTLTMGIEAAKKVLNTANLKGSDIDMIVFTSQLPEYTMPSQALIVHHFIEGKLETICMDMNVNCIGMLMAVENATKYMKSSPNVKKALIIGSDYTSIHTREDEINSFPSFGDAACALILEAVEDEDNEKNSGYIDSLIYTGSPLWDVVKYPGCGMSKIHNKEISAYDKLIDWTPFNGMHVVQHAVDSINIISKRSNFEIDDIKAYCFSQFADVFAESFSPLINTDKEKFIYVGDKYGYTGTSSPFIALYEAVKSGKVKRGDIVWLWSVAINWTICTLVIRY